MARSSITSALYRAARASADARAVTRGPGAVARRQVRRAVYKHTGRVTRRVLRSFGL